MDSRKPIDKSNRIYHTPVGSGRIPITEAYTSEEVEKINSSSGSFKSLNELTEKEKEYHIEVSQEERELFEQFPRLERASLYWEWKNGNEINQPFPITLVEFLQAKLQERNNF